MTKKVPQFNKPSGTAGLVNPGGRPVASEPAEMTDPSEGENEEELEQASVEFAITLILRTDGSVSFVDSTTYEDQEFKYIDREKGLVEMGKAHRILGDAFRFVDRRMMMNELLVQLQQVLTANSMQTAERVVSGLQSMLVSQKLAAGGGLLKT